jgi:hypothetical protein
MNRTAAITSGGEYDTSSIRCGSKAIAGEIEYETRVDLFSGIGELHKY